MPGGFTSEIDKKGLAMSREANWNCPVCRGFGVIDCSGSRDESRRCPACFPVEPDPGSGSGAAWKGPFSIWHVHGDVRDPDQATCQANTNDPEDAQVIALDRATIHASGAVAVYDATGEPFLIFSCPMVTRRRRIAA